jgi:hypothetical protein
VQLFQLHLKERGIGAFSLLQMEFSMVLLAGLEALAIHNGTNTNSTPLFISLKSRHKDAKMVMKLLPTISCVLTMKVSGVL